MTDNPAENDAMLGDDNAKEKSPPFLAQAELLRGCNAFHHSSVMRQVFSLGWLADVQTGELGADFTDAFLQRFLSLKTIVPEGPLRADFVTRMQATSDVPIEEILLQAIRSVEGAIFATSHSLDRVDFATFIRDQNRQQSILVWETFSARISRAASETAFAGMLELLPEPIRPEISTTFEASFSSLIEQAKRRRLSPTSAVLKQAAKRRGLPVEGIAGQHLRLGQGARQHQIYSSMTGFTSISATKLAIDKRQTNRRLREVRLPVPDQIRVSSSEQAEEAAAKLGHSVVIKPLRGSRGGGVTAGLGSADEVKPAFEHAAASESGVLVERFIPGIDHRMLVVGDHFLAALIRVPPRIVGDGARTVEGLIEDLNADPYRDGFRLFPVKFDKSVEAHLRSQGYGINDVPDSGVEITLRSTSNVSTGGVPIDVTDRVHPDNRRMAEAAAKAIGLDVAGVDFITEDIARSYKETGGGIVEINARPGLCMHTWPWRGAARDVASSILELIFPAGDAGSVPRILVAGDRGTGAMARRVEHLLRCAGLTTGLSLREEAYLDGNPLDLENARLQHAAKILLKESALEAFVAAVSLRRTARYGLQLDACDAAAILPPSLDGDRGIFLQGAEIVAKANRGRFVLWSEDTEARVALKSVTPERLLLVASQPDDDLAQAHIEAGYAAVVRHAGHDGACFTLYDQGEPLLSLPFASFRDATRPLKLRDIETRMFAAALAFASGIKVPLIEQALGNPHGRRLIQVRRNRILIPPSDHVGPPTGHFDEQGKPTQGLN
ncbi:MAG: ATP-grasp domain-containing protein [Geminicoccaceae bacterium]